VNGDRVERRLAAILAADVAGYSRLMGEDEEGTLAQLRAYRRELIDPRVAEHHGRIVKTTGDGLLIEFPSVVEAVSCAITVQRTIAERNARMPVEQKIVFRMGVNLGDIIVEDGDIHGDGVNIAARLEGIAEPGGICISEDAFRQVRGKIEAEFTDLGDQNLKNIARPVRVYRIGQRAAEAHAPSLPLPDKPSIAVLPFQNISGDPEQEYFADGMVEEIITAISRVRWFFVIARNSTFTYKGRAVDVKQVGRELGVRYVLEGSVRKAGNRVRITAQLIEAATSNHIWAERYDRELADIFAVQDEITERIVAAIEPELYAAENFRSQRKPAREPRRLGVRDPRPFVCPDGHAIRKRGGRGVVSARHHDCAQLWSSPQSACLGADAPSPLVERLPVHRGRGDGGSTDGNQPRRGGSLGAFHSWDGALAIASPRRGRAGTPSSTEIEP
jgi:adenylate cyclase